MSGHSKWAQIKHKKGIADQKRGQVFSKLARNITIAAKSKGTDTALNPQLRAAIEKAQEMNMPKDNIDRALERAKLQSGENLTEIIMEAYGPGGTAILIKAITDNKNRTVQELRHLIQQYGGKPAQEGSVRWLFEHCGRITVGTHSLPLEDLELAAIEAGAQDITSRHIDGHHEMTILTKPEDLYEVRKKLLEKNIQVESSELDFMPKTALVIGNDQKEALEKLFEVLDEHDYVQEIYSNVEL